MKNDLRYTPSTCFETFPFPNPVEPADTLEKCGDRYYAFRATLMVKAAEGLTETYNRFHNPEERSADIVELRRLHEAMDRVVLDAYGWQDIPTACEFFPEFDDEDEDEETGRPNRARKKYRYRWPDEVHDEVLARLLALNAERAALQSPPEVKKPAAKTKASTKKSGKVSESDKKAPGLFE